MELITHGYSFLSLKYQQVFAESPFMPSASFGSQHFQRNFNFFKWKTIGRRSPGCSLDHLAPRFGPFGSYLLRHGSIRPAEYHPMSSYIMSKPSAPSLSPSPYK
ncbi:uncharacterized protein ARMOST_22346 [Armillaria ostoyae]|uniref:Uncharacterized protein n=1 Tax=Armillaria ostoyae TaxID=47428 RepID=A0A284SCM4_ARMOS|nr:uncharacterized protein ARMOST_22346 [Armillaria ostoyae]